MEYGLIGQKKEMTQIFNEKGYAIPVTLVDISGCKIVGKVGTRVVVGYGNKKNPTKSEIGKYKELGFVPEIVKEFELAKETDAKLGSSIIESLEIGHKVMVSSKTKGKGFQGVVKRWGFAGGPKTHGQSDRHRAPGSIGGGTTPGRVYKGKKMPGRMGGKIKTVKGLIISYIDKENGILGIKGAIPGHKNTFVIIRK